MLEHIPKGRHMPAIATVTDRRALRLMMLASISSPTMKRKRQRPIFAVSVRYGRESSGNMCWVNPGIRPKAVGPISGTSEVALLHYTCGCDSPSRMPPMTSAITLGCLILPSPNASSWVMEIMTPTWFDIGDYNWVAAIFEHSPSCMIHRRSGSLVLMAVGSCPLSSPP